MTFNKTLKEFYPNAGWDDRPTCCIGSYTMLIESFPAEILESYDFGDYEGDSLILLKHNNKYGVLVFGWGSCAGCDALEACSTIEDLEELRLSLFNNVTLFDTPTELIKYLKEHDWEGDYLWYYKPSEAINSFIKTLEDFE